MRSNVIQRLPSILRRGDYRISLLAGLSLFGYICFLLVTNYLSQVELREAALKRLQYDIEKRTVAVAYYFSERQSDLKNLLASREIRTYFENQALGMSMTYGLRTSLFNITKRFESFIDHRTINDDPIYHRILLVDRHGNTLADNQRISENAKKDRNWIDFLTPLHPDPGIYAHASKIMIGAPYFFKGRYEGQIVAWIAPTSLYDHLIREKAAPHQYVGIVAGQSNFYQPEDMPPGVLYDGLTELAKVADGEYRCFEVTSPTMEDKTTEIIALRSSVKDTPFSLMSIIPLANVVGIRSPQQLLMTLAILAVVFVAGFALVWRANLQKMVIRTKLKETAKREKMIKVKNLALAKQVAERKQIAERLSKSKKVAEEASRAKSEFLANMSHELRTPLNHIIGFTELVADENVGALNNTQKDYLTDALGSSQHLLSLINDILDLSKVEAGKMELATSTVDLKMILEGSLVMIREGAMKKNIKVVTNIGTIPESINADERKLKQVLYNLISNAVKFTSKGGDISLSAESVPDRRGKATGSKIRISVTDTGIGLDAKNLEMIFDPFGQVESSKSRRFQGTGLGLAITKQFVELHGGTIWAESNGINQGSTFTFVIPSD